MLDLESLMIVLKHLANEFNVDPYKLRQHLRQKWGLRRRWRWDPDLPADAKHLKKVREDLRVSFAPHQD